MNFTFVKVIMLLGILFFNFEIVHAEETLKYELTKDKVYAAGVSKAKGGLYSVDIKLKESNWEDFRRLTVNNIGKRLAITFSGRVLMSATIRAEIENGSMVLELNSEEEANKLVDALDPEHKGTKFESERIFHELRDTTKAERIAYGIYSCANEEPTIDNLSSLYEMLDSHEVILKNDLVYSSANIQVRDIALVKIEQMTGEDFLGNCKSKDIITYFSEDGTPFRFTIPSLSEDKYKEAKRNIGYWIKGFKKGVEIMKTMDSSPRSE